MSKKSTAVIEFRKRVKISLVKSFGNHCALCGKEYPEYVYDFHHIDPSTKEFGISENGLTQSKEKTFQEAKKCVMLCSNCHRVVHHENICSFPYAIEPDKEEYLTSFKALLKNKKRLKTIQTGSNSEGGKGHSILPEREELKKLIRTQTFKSIALEYNVTDYAVRKNARKNGLPTNKKDINSYSDEEWKKL